MHIPNPTADFWVSTSGVSTFLSHSGLGKCCHRLVHTAVQVVFVTGNKSAFSGLPLCPAWVCSRLTSLFCPWSFSPSSRQSMASLVAQPVVAGPGCEFCLDTEHLCALEQMTEAFLGFWLMSMKGLKNLTGFMAAWESRFVECSAQMLSTMPARNDCLYIGCLLF